MELGLGALRVDTSRHLNASYERLRTEFNEKGLAVSGHGRCLTLDKYGGLPHVKGKVFKLEAWHLKFQEVGVGRFPEVCRSAQRHSKPRLYVCYGYKCLDAVSIFHDEDARQGHGKVVGDL